jgi:hypothetical protein
VRAALAATAGAVLLAGCGGDKKSASSSPRFHYSKQLEQSFMRACTAGGTVKESVCACTLDKLSESVSTQDFRRMQLSGGDIPPRIRTAIQQAANACRDS